MRARESERGGHTRGREIKARERLEEELATMAVHGSCYWVTLQHHIVEYKHSLAIHCRLARYKEMERGREREREG